LLLDLPGIKHEKMIYSDITSIENRGFPTARIASNKKILKNFFRFIAD